MDFGDPSLLDVLAMNKGIAHQFFIEPWQLGLGWVSVFFLLLGPLVLVAMLQGSSMYILYLTLQYIGETVWALCKRSRHYSGPKIWDPSKRRRRRLSVDTQARDRKKEQEGSAFFTRLPLEIRLEIYQLLLGSRALNIDVDATGPWKIVGTLPFRKHAYIQMSSSDCVYPTHPDPYAAARDRPSSKDLLPTLMVCRQMYREAVSVLYASNTFKFSKHGDVHLFLESILPQRRQVIRRIVVEISSPRPLDSLLWKRSELYRLDGLRELYVYISLKYWCHDTTDLSEILKIVLPERMTVFQIGVPKEFHVPERGFQVRRGGEYVLVRKDRW